MEMCSGIFLKEQVEEFCRVTNQDLGEIWQVINRIHTKQFGRNIMWEKEQFQRDNHTGDIPMSEWFARTETVRNAMEILIGLRNCIKNDWSFE